MEIIAILIKQVVTMFLLVGVGYLMFRRGKISLEGSKTLGNILIYLSLPCVIINGFLVEKTQEHIVGLIYSAILAAVVLLISIVISRLVFKTDAIAAFAGAFSNPGFFGIPLITACLSNGAVFYVASFIALLNLLQWTYGVAIMTSEGSSEKKKISELITPGKVLTAPFMIAIIIGLVLFFSGLTLPSIVKNCVTFLSGLNTPLAMFTVGVYLAQTNMTDMVKKPKLYAISSIRLLAVPLIAALLLILIPNSLQEMKLAILISIACPVGSNIAVYAQLHNKNYSYAVETVIISTILSIVTIPAVTALALSIW